MYVIFTPDAPVVEPFLLFATYTSYVSTSPFGSVPVIENVIEFVVLLLTFILTVFGGSFFLFH